MSRHLNLSPAIFLLSLALVAGLIFSACSTAPARPTAASVFTPANTRTATTLGAALVLRNNPRLVPAFRDLNAQVDQVLTTGALVITPDLVARALQPIAERHGLLPADTAALAALITSLADQAAAGLSVPALSTADTRALPYIAAFHDGLAAALSLYPQ